MVSWRDEILKEFTPGAGRLTLVADPDGLLLEEGILRGIEERGFELIPFEDHVAFRYAYESRYRARWDRGELADLVVVLRAAATDLCSLPYDLLQAGRRLEFNLGDLFPNLSYPVVTALDRIHFEALYEAQVRQHPGRLGDNATKDFVLRHVFGVAPELVKQSSDLLRILLRRHYQALRIPELLDHRLIQLLRQSGSFQEWPLNAIVSDREAFFVFLQERWPIFLDQLSGGSEKVAEGVSGYGLAVTGPELLPFDHDDVRVYLDNLFLEGFLEPVAHPHADEFVGKWVVVGVRTDPASDRLRRWDGLFRTLSASVPDSAAPHQKWQEFAPKWSQLIALKHRVGSGFSEDREREFAQLRERVDGVFLIWMKTRYGTLHNQPPDPATMVHHIPRLMARRLEGSDAKVALVVVDGLSLDQWIILREVLRAQWPNIRLREATVFAWVPTVTSVSRQACFCGTAPVYYPLTINSTDADSKGWRRFWEEQGLAPGEVGYERGVRDVPDLERVELLISHPKMRAIGLVVDSVDRIMHGMELGSAGMHNQVRQWAEQGFLKSLLEKIADANFELFLTSDHGNVEAEGIGQPAEGSVADMRGERVRVYQDVSLRARVQQRFPAAIEWPTIGLPEDYHALIAPGRSAFTRKGDKPVSHCGITVEEVLVPLVRIECTT